MEQTGTRIRTSDTERERTAEILRAAMGEGRLTLDEGEQRLAAAYAATYRDELSPLTADLPDGGRTALHHTPEARVEARRRLRVHTSVATIVIGVLIAIWALNGAHFFWPIFVIVPLVLSVLRHAAWLRSGGGEWPGPHRHHRHHRHPHTC